MNLHIKLEYDMISTPPIVIMKTTKLEMKKCLTLDFALYNVRNKVCIENKKVLIKAYTNTE